MAREKAEKALADFLRPEFLARVDEVIVFQPLTEEDFKGIASLMVEELKPALMEKGIRFDCQEEALQKIAKEAFGHKGLRHVGHPKAAGGQSDGLKQQKKKLRAAL